MRHAVSCAEPMVRWRNDRIKHDTQCAQTHLLTTFSPLAAMELSLFRKPSAISLKIFSSFFKQFRLFSGCDLSSCEVMTRDCEFFTKLRCFSNFSCSSRGLWDLSLSIGKRKVTFVLVLRSVKRAGRNYSVPGHYALIYVLASRARSSARCERSDTFWNWVRGEVGDPFLHGTNLVFFGVAVKKLGTR